MDLIEKLNSINRPPVPTLQLNLAYNMDELREQLLAMYNVDKNIVLQWHKLLMDYVKMDHPMFAIRGYHTFTPDKYDCLRRGFLTETEKFLYFHTDNYFAAYFLKMCLDGYVPELLEFYNTLASRQFPSRFGHTTKEERELMGLKQGIDPGINRAGFKLAHIIPVGKEYIINGRTVGIQAILNMYFPIGERTDWKLHSDEFGTYYMRKLHETNPDMKKIAIAHFLRFIHPFNYFICPKKACEVNIMCKELAEYQPLLDNMHDYMLQTYGDAYQEYLSYILVDEKYSNDMYKVDGKVKVVYGRVFESATPDFKQLLKGLLDGTISVLDPDTDTISQEISQEEENETIEQEDANDSNHKHKWTYEEDEFCVRMVFYNYVQYKYHDVSGVVAEIYEHLKCVIKSSSIHMKLSNIKHLLNEEHITNSLSVKPLSQASSQCRKAFERVYAEFKKNGGHINDPMNDTPDTRQTKPTITDDISYTRYIDSTQSTFVTPPKTVSPGYRYQWKYSDDEFCVRMVFYNFIYHHSHDVQEVVTKIYIHLNGAIKESSIHMKLSNIKYLLDEEGIESSMPDSSLSQVSNQCRRAFNRVYEEYKNNGYKIADPTKTSMPGAGPDGGPDLTPPPPPKPELPTYKIKVILNGETYFYRHNVHDNTNNLIKDFGFLRATALFQVESKITAEALQKQYPSAIIEIVENVSDR